MDSFKSYDSKGVQKGQKEELLKKINESQLVDKEKPTFPDLMYFRKPWKTIVITLVTLSSAGSQFHNAKNQIERFNMLFGASNSLFFYASDINKQFYMLIETIIGVFAPAAAGYMLDKS